MATVAEFLKHLVDSDILPSEDLEQVRAAGAAFQDSDDAEPLARDVVRRKLLTPFQATLIYRGRPGKLNYGSYVVLDKLGEGGMGVVLKARHRRLGRIVALKVLPLAAIRSSKDAVKRFDREMEAAARLSHPNIVQAYDADSAGGIRYLAMEYVAGLDLQACIVRFGPMSVEKAVLCLLHAARGLEHAHENGIIHRDIKPSNLLLDERGTVRVLDLGLARLDGSAASGEALSEEGLTRTGTVMGTLDYMSPEQALDTKHADHRTDVYSLGCTLYYLLTGGTVYAGDTMMKKLLAHREQPIPSLRAARPDVPESLDRLFQRLVAKAPEQRFQTMSEVVAALSDWLDRNTGASPTPAGNMHSSRTSFEPTDRGFPLHEDGDDEGLAPTRVITPDDAPTRATTTRGFDLRSKRARTLLASAAGLVLAAAAIVWWTSPRPTPSAANGVNDVSSRGGVSNGAAPEARWMSLFNGRDLSGWQAAGASAAGRWTVVDGVLRGRGENSYLFTEREFGDFELRAEVRVIHEADNAGLFFRTREGESLPPGFEAQIGRWGFGELHILDKNGVATVAAAPRDPVTPGEWIELHVAATGNRIEIRVAGQVAVDHTDARADAPRSGRIALQAYTPETQLEVRRIEVRELPQRGAGAGAPDGRTADGPPAAVAPFDAAAATRFQESWAARLKTARTIENSLGMKFALIPPGRFRMGSPDQQAGRAFQEGPAREVEITRPFFFGAHEVTQHDYRRVMGNNPSTHQKADPDGGRLPVEFVTWSDAVSFCEKLSALDAERQAGRKYRLPTEAEWEYACRAGTASAYASGAQLSEKAAQINQPRNAGRSATVGTFAANPFGLYDMHGNVWEWCRDWYDPTYYQAGVPVDPPGPLSSPQSMRAIRGGCFFYTANEARSAYRNSADPTRAASNIGFRAVMETVR